MEEKNDTEKLHILIDWLTFSSKIHDEKTAIELLGLSHIKEWIPKYGFYGYATRLYFGGISIHFNGYKADMGICVEMSGEGCQTFRTYGNGQFENGYSELFKLLQEEHIKKNMNLTRLDIACDDKDGILDIDKMYDDTENGNFTAKAKERQLITTKKKDKIKGELSAKSIIFGKRVSNVLIRIYDKGKEQEFKGKEVDNVNWIRIELQLRREMAMTFISLKEKDKITNEEKDIDIGIKFSRVLNNYLCFRIPDKNNKQKTRWDIASYWKRFLNSVQKIRLYEKTIVDISESVKKLRRYVINKASNSINLFIELYGEEELLNVLEEHKKNSKYNEQHKRILSEHKIWKQAEEDKRIIL